MRRADSFLPRQPTPFRKLSMTFMVWIISVSQLGDLSGYAPSQHLHTCSLAEYEKLEEVLDFTATTENVSVTNILLLLNPKHSSCWEANSLYPSRNQDISECLEIEDIFSTRSMPVVCQGLTVEKNTVFFESCLCQPKFLIVLASQILSMEVCKFLQC